MIELFILYIILGVLITSYSLLDEYWETEPDVQDFGYWDWLGMFFMGVAIWPLFMYWYFMPPDDE